jgi:hypothetical protein
MICSRLLMLRARAVSAVSAVFAVVGVFVVVVVSAGCVERGVRLAIDARAAPSAATLQAAVYVDDGGGCAAWRFAVAPALTPVDIAVVPGDEPFVPRDGDKIIVVDARDTAGSSVARACVAIGIVDEVVERTATLVPTVQVVPVGEARVLLDPGAPLAVIVRDASGAAVAGHAVAVRVVDGEGAVVEESVATSDDEGRVAFVPVPRDDGRGLGLLRVTFRGAEPLVDTPAVVDVLRAPDESSPLGDLPRGDPRPVVVDGVAAVVVRDDDGSGFSLLGPGTAPVPLAPGQLVGARFVGAFDGPNALLLFAVGDQLVAVGGDGTLLDVRPVRDVDFSAARAVGVGACNDGHDRPMLFIAGDDAFLVDVRFGALVVVDAPATLPRAALSSGCVVDDAGVRSRVLFGRSSEAQGPVSLGPGLARVEDVATLATAQLVAPPGIVHYSVRDDGVVLGGVVDGGEVLMRPLLRRGDALVDRDDERPFRLPSPPLLVRQGPLIGGQRDVLALLDLSTEADVDASALYAVQGALAQGTGAVCRPLEACARSLFVDVDGDGRADLLTAFDGVPRLVRFVP